MGIHFTSPAGTKIYSKSNGWKGVLNVKKQSVIFAELANPVRDGAQQKLVRLIGRKCQMAGLNADGTAEVVKIAVTKIYDSLGRGTNVGSVPDVEGIIASAIGDARVQQVGKARGDSRAKKSAQHQRAALLMQKLS